MRERLAEFSFFSDDGGTKRVNAVVPRSADTPLAQDGEYSLFRLVVFSRLADEVRQKCREKGYQVREFKLKGDRGGDPDEELRRLRTEAGEAGRELSEWWRSRSDRNDNGGGAGGGGSGGGLPARAGLPSSP